MCATILQTYRCGCPPTIGVVRFCKAGNINDVRACKGSSVAYGKIQIPQCIDCDILFEDMHRAELDHDLAELWTPPELRKRPMEITQIVQWLDGQQQEMRRYG